MQSSQVDASMWKLTGRSLPEWDSLDCSVSVMILRGCVGSQVNVNLWAPRLNT